MNEGNIIINIIVALIGCTGSVLAALIAAYATIRAAKVGKVKSTEKPLTQHRIENKQTQQPKPNTAGGIVGGVVGGIAGSFVCVTCRLIGPPVIGSITAELPPDVAVFIAQFYFPIEGILIIIIGLIVFMGVWLIPG